MLAVAAGPAPATDKLGFHVDAARSGWNSREQTLTPAGVRGGNFGPLWSSPRLDSSGATPPRLFATPLYLSDVDIADSRGRQVRVPVVYAASATGFVYAIATRNSALGSAGAILWRKAVTPEPCRRGSLGILGTPVIDRSRQRIYVGYCDERRLWSVTALDVRTGAAIGGWPVTLDASTINQQGINRNGTNRFPATLQHLQRSALNLSPDGARLYVTFGGEPTSGWIVAVDTRRARVASAFSVTRRTEEGVGGIWAAGGAAVDAQGYLYVSTGSSVLNTLADMGVAGVFPGSVGNWGQSVLKLSDSQGGGLRLRGSYTPFNYCQAGARDMDLGASSPALIDLEPGAARATRLLALGGAKQGNAYLLDRERMPGSLVRRQPCSDDPSTDRSLLAPQPQPHFGRRGPLNVFGPYSERDGMGDQARSRSTLAHFRDASGGNFLYLTGSAKSGPALTQSTTPSLARLRIVTERSRPPYLVFDGSAARLLLQNPGSPVISSNGSQDAIVWILDPNKPRSASLYGPDAPRPVLYAVDAKSLEVLWQSPPGQLYPGGKYNEPTIVDGQVIVGTDRIQAFGLGARLAAGGDASVLVSAESPAQEATVAHLAIAGNAEDAAVGAKLYEQRCAACHDAPLPGTPSRTQLSGVAAGLIVEKLLWGSMQTQALGLDEAQLAQIALYVTR